MYMSDLISKRELYISNKICVKKSNIHRWGVFCKENILKNEILEESPYFLVPMKEIEQAKTCLQYSYPFDENSKIIGMGNCGLYNHSFSPNVDYQIDNVNEIMRHYAIRDINIGEELTLNYGEENVTEFIKKYHVK